MNNDKNINGRLRKAFDNATPYVYDDIKRDCPPRSATTTKQRTINYWKWASFAMAFVLLVVGVLSIVGLVRGGNNTAMAETTVSLDVNPGLQINVDGNGRVIDVVAVNDDAQNILGTIDFSGSTLEVTVYALVGSMYAKGYLSEASNSVLVDVDTKGDKAKILASVTAQITGALNSNQITPNVIVSKSSDELTTEEQKQAEDVQQSYDISPAKARLIAQIMQHDVNNKHDIASLVKLKVNDLSLILEGQLGTSIGSGTTSEGLYIGKVAAEQAALDAFGITDAQAANLSIRTKLDFEDGRMVYEVEFVLDGKKYECEVVASRTVKDSGKVYETEIKLIGNVPEKDLSYAERLALKETIVAKSLVEANVSLSDVADVTVLIKNNIEFDDDDYVVTVNFNYNNTHFKFDFDYDGRLVESKVKHTVDDRDYMVDVNKLYEYLKENWNIRFGIFDIGIDQIDWDVEIEHGMFKCETEIVTLTGKYEIEIYINCTTGVIVQFDIERD